MKTPLSFLVALLAVALAATAIAEQTTEQVQPDAAAVAVVGQFVAAFSHDTEEARNQALVAVLHPVALNDDGTDVHNNMKRIFDRRVEDARKAGSPPTFEKVDKITVVSGNKHRFGALETDVVWHFWVKAGDKTFRVIVVDDGGPKVVGML